MLERQSLILSSILHEHLIKLEEYQVRSSWQEGMALPYPTSVPKRIPPRPESHMNMPGRHGWQRINA